MPIKHPFVSPKSDSADNTIVQPSDWNDEHVIENASLWEHVDERPTVSAAGRAYFVTTGVDAGKYFVVPTEDEIVELPISTVTNKANINYFIDGGGSPITTGYKGEIQIPFNCTIVGWSLVSRGGISGSIVVDVWRDTYANFPPTVADTIAGTEKPTLASAAKNEDNNLTTWTTAIAEGDWLGFNVDSASTVTSVTLVLSVIKT